MIRQMLRRAAALTMALLTLWAVVTTVGSQSLPEALQAIRGESLPRQVVRWQLGDVFTPRSLSLTTLLVLYESPLLLSARNVKLPTPQQDVKQRPPTPKSPEKEPEIITETNQPEAPAQPQPPAAEMDDPTAGLAFEENGVRSETVRPNNGNYTAADPTRVWTVWIWTAAPLPPLTHPKAPRC